MKTKERTLRGLPKEEATLQSELLELLRNGKGDSIEYDNKINALQRVQRILYKKKKNLKQYK